MRGSSGERTPGPFRGSAAHSRNRPPRPRSLHRYGQNHLVDTNILRAIVAQAAVQEDDVVLEVGAADGQLTRPLLKQASIVHAFEIDGRFAAGLNRLAVEHGNLRVHLGDALKHDLGALTPAPTAIVANLAYNIAIPLIMTSIERLPGMRSWAVMVQKELADRLFALPSTKAYAAVSVLVQVACCLEKTRHVPPSAFRPQPRVNSSFVTFRRWRPGEYAALVCGEDYDALGLLVRRAFGQRRKVLTNSLAGAVGPQVTLTRANVAEALGQLEFPAAARPEELSPPQWVAFAGRLGWI